MCYIFVFYFVFQILSHLKEIDMEALDFLLRYPATSDTTSPVDFLNDLGWGGIKVNVLQRHSGERKRERGRERDKVRERQKDRQTDRQTVRQTKGGYSVCMSSGVKVKPIFVDKKE